MFEKKTIGQCLCEVELAAHSLSYWLRAYERGAQQVYCSGAQQLRRGLRLKDRPITSLRHQGGEEVSERGTISLTV